jgi:hypothetical protein
MAAMFSLLALLGIANATKQIYGNSRQEMLWVPSLVGFLALMTIAAIGAPRAIRAARSLAKEATEASAMAAKKAFEKFRIYFFCAAIVFLVSEGLAAFVR